MFVCFVFCYSHKLLKMKTPPVEKGFAMLIFTQQEDGDSVWNSVIVVVAFLFFRDSVSLCTALELAL